MWKTTKIHSSLRKNRLHCWEYSNWVKSLWKTVFCKNFKIVSRHFRVLDFFVVKFDVFHHFFSQCQKVGWFFYVFCFFVDIFLMVSSSSSPINRRHDKASLQLFFHLPLFKIIAKFLCYMCHWKFSRVASKLLEAFDTDVCFTKFKAFSANWKSFSSFMLLFYSFHSVFCCKKRGQSVTQYRKGEEKKQPYYHFPPTTHNKRRKTYNRHKTDDTTNNGNNNAI